MIVGGDDQGEGSLIARIDAAAMLNNDHDNDLEPEEDAPTDNVIPGNNNDLEPEEDAPTDNVIPGNNNGELLGFDVHGISDVPGLFRRVEGAKDLSGSEFLSLEDYYAILENAAFFKVVQDDYALCYNSVLCVTPKSHTASGRPIYPTDGEMKYITKRRLERQLKGNKSIRIYIRCSTNVGGYYTERRIYHLKESINMLIHYRKLREGAKSTSPDRVPGSDRHRPSRAKTPSAVGPGLAPHARVQAGTSHPSRAAGPGPSTAVAEDRDLRAEIAALREKTGEDAHTILTNVDILNTSVINLRAEMQALKEKNVEDTSTILASLADLNENVVNTRVEMAASRERV